MNIDRLYTRDVISVPQSTTLDSAARVMAANHVGSLLVTQNPPENRCAIGIVTDRDLVVQAVAAGADPKETTVAEVMTSQLARVYESADVHRALDTMARYGIRSLAVTADNGEIVGVLSFDDIVDGLAIEMSDLARIVRQERRREKAVTVSVPAASPVTS
ncbi:MAG: CBS domain-containing protein [Burkholderiales bacterium]